MQRGKFVSNLFRTSESITDELVIPEGFEGGLVSNLELPTQEEEAVLDDTIGLHVDLPGLFDFVAKINAFDDWHKLQVIPSGLHLVPGEFCLWCGRKLKQRTRPTLYCPGQHCRVEHKRHPEHTEQSWACEKNARAALRPTTKPANFPVVRREFSAIDIRHELLSEELYLSCPWTQSYRHRVEHSIGTQHSLRFVIHYGPLTAPEPIGRPKTFKYVCGHPTWENDPAFLAAQELWNEKLSKFRVLLDCGRWVYNPHPNARCYDDFCTYSNPGHCGEAIKEFIGASEKYNNRGRNTSRLNYHTPEQLVIFEANPWRHSVWSSDDYVHNSEVYEGRDSQKVLGRELQKALKENPLKLGIEPEQKIAWTDAEKAVDEDSDITVHPKGRTPGSSVHTIARLQCIAFHRKSVHEVLQVSAPFGAIKAAKTVSLEPVPEVPWRLTIAPKDHISSETLPHHSIFGILPFPVIRGPFRAVEDNKQRPAPPVQRALWKELSKPIKLAQIATVVGLWERVPAQLPTPSVEQRIFHGVDDSFGTPAYWRCVPTSSSSILPAFKGVVTTPSTRFTPATITESVVERIPATDNRKVFGPLTYAQSEMQRVINKDLHQAEGKIATGTRRERGISGGDVQQNHTMSTFYKVPELKWPEIQPRKERECPICPSFWIKDTKPFKPVRVMSAEELAAYKQRPAWKPVVYLHNTFGLSAERIYEQCAAWSDGLGLAKPSFLEYERANTCFVPQKQQEKPKKITHKNPWTPKQLDPLSKENFCPLCTERVMHAGVTVRETKGMYLPIEHECVGVYNLHGDLQETTLTVYAGLFPTPLRDPR